MVIKSIHTNSIHHPWTILCDFDGTISYKDVTDTLLDTFGMPGWQALEQRWEKGEIGSQECMSGQIALLNASQEELNACLASINIDPYFADFVRHAAMHNVPLHIVSDGLDYAIRYILQANGINNIPIIANQLQQVGERSWSLNFPFYSPHCLKASGTCKCTIAQKFSHGKFLMIGDGRSDFCVSQIADHVFAKKDLIKECKRSGVSFSVIEDFSQAPNRLDWLLQQKNIAKFASIEHLTQRGIYNSVNSLKIGE